MGNGTLKLGFERIGKIFIDHLPGILSGVACGLVVAEGVTMYYKAPKIKAAISETKASYEEVKDGEFKEKAGVVAVGCLEVGKEIAPSIIAAGSAMACIIFSHKEHLKREGILLTGLAASQINNKNLKEWQEEAKKALGKKKSEEVDQTLAAKKFSEINPDDPYLQYSDSDPSRDALFFDENTGALWRDNYLNVLNKVNDIYIKVKQGEPASVLELYNGLNLDRYGQDRIRVGAIASAWIFDPFDYQHASNVEDLIQIVPGDVGPDNAKKFKLVYNPTLAEDVIARVKLDDVCGDGYWRSRW